MRDTYREHRESRCQFCQSVHQLGQTIEQCELYAILLINRCFFCCEMEEHKNSKITELKSISAFNYLIVSQQYITHLAQHCSTFRPTCYIDGTINFYKPSKVNWLRYGTGI